MADVEDDFLEELEAIQARQLLRTSASTMPPANPRKRPRGSSPNGGSSDNENDRPLAPLPELLSTGNTLVTRNVATAVKNYAKKQKLRGDQLTQVEAFLTDVQTIRDAKVYINLLALQNDVQKIIATQPAYTVSQELKVNIQAYVPPVLLSEHLGGYKGDVPVQHVFEIIKKNRFDTPPGFENNPADCNKVIKEIQETFTQSRARYKKILFASVKVTQNKKVIDLPAEKHQNLFGLAQAFVDGTKCRITGGLCGRIALMRKVFLKYPGSNFWDKLDARLVMMREQAKGSKDAIELMFEGLIEDDKESHGNVNIVYQATDTLQEEVDAAIIASAIDVAITVDLTASDGNTGEGGGEDGAPAASGSTA
ncbi:hypothetical protein B0H11DRAFT_561581 [Mycena galericulata]|nr:hypothetical protein B0H11DRAFT_561581 [Mycena galericulata]